VSDLYHRIRAAQVRAGEQAVVVDDLRERGLIPADDPACERNHAADNKRLRELLKRAEHALRSYQYGSPSLAEDLVREIEAARRQGLL
jgi:predicted secreted Zn-dependent protease